MTLKHYSLPKWVNSTLSLKKNEVHTILDSSMNNWQEVVKTGGSSKRRTMCSCWAPQSIKKKKAHLHTPPPICKSTDLCVWMCIMCAFVCLLFVSWQTSIIMQPRAMMLCFHHRVPILLSPCFHHFSPLLFYTHPLPSHWVSVLHWNNAAQCPHIRDNHPDSPGTVWVRLTLFTGPIPNQL